MKIKILLVKVVIVLVVLSGCSKKDKTLKMKITENWEFSQAEKNEWKPAVVPGCVHTDLMMNGIIKDPFYRTNEHDQQWIDKNNWNYRTKFTIDEKILNKDRVKLFFYGLDTYAEVYLNDSYLLSANNMFRHWSADCKDLLKKGENVLFVHFTSPVSMGLEKYNENDYVIPVSSNDQSELGGLGDKKVSVYTRKAGYHFGWDWGPRLVTSGIWRPVVLKAWDQSIIRDVFVIQNKISEEKADLAIQLNVDSEVRKEADFCIRLNGDKVENVTIMLKKGTNSIELPLAINNPELWWPNGMGEQNMYEVTATLKIDDVIVSEKSVNTGLRTIKLVQEKDSVGTGFYFEVNEKPFFVKGANYIPQDVFVPRVTSDRYEHILQSAVDANMNMLRVWGGGIYENDIFYEKCDEKGLLVWQDFMFACAMFPGNKSFLENVRQEAKQNVIRLRNHPCIALWCGNNEVLSAWFNWGWKERYEKEDPEAAKDLWNTYETIFHKILPEAVERYDSKKDYWASSPQSSRGVPKSWTSGDVHYWDVWWGQKPFATYKDAVGRFMSEYGFQSFPDLTTVKKYAKKEDWDIFSEVMKAHQRSSIGNGTIANYMKRHYKDPKDFPSFLYVGQLLQARGIKTAIQAQRKARPYCMGSLYWQLDDCWPVASWSGIDYYGRWKALHYAVKKAFDDYLIVPELINDSVMVSLISDKYKDTSVKFKLILFDFSGNVLWNIEERMKLPAASSNLIFSEQLDDILKEMPEERVLLNALLFNEKGELLADNILYFVPPKELELPENKITFKVDKADDGYQITLHTDKLAKNVYLSFDEDVNGMFSDNYFDLLPAKKKEVYFYTNDDIQNLNKQIKIITLIDTYE